MKNATSPLRYDGLDVVRAGAMLLGVCYHAAYAYVPDIGRWYFVTDVASSPGFLTLVGVLHAFRMQLFFSLAGFFAHLVLERRGPRGFLVDRSRRLMVPFAFALPLMLTADVLVRRWSLAEGVMSPDFPAQGAVQWAPSHLWFLEYLFLFSVAAWGLARVGWEGQRAARWLSLALRVPEVLLLAAAPLGLALMQWGEVKPALSFLPEPHALFHYGAFFALGWVLWLARDAVEVLVRRGWWMAAVGLALAWYVFSRPLQWQPWGHFLGGVVPVLVTVGCLGLAFRVPPATRPWLRFLVESSYWVYLVHFPVVLALQVLVAKWAWPAGLKYALVVGATFALAFASFRLLVYRSGLGPWLGVKPAPKLDEGRAPG
ncbi:MAG: acyltransferase family protein [Myxococcota bacterium]